MKVSDHEEARRQWKKRHAVTSKFLESVQDEPNMTTPVCYACNNVPTLFHSCENNVCAGRLCSTCVVKIEGYKKGKKQKCGVCKTHDLSLSETIDITDSPLAPIKKTVKDTLSVGP